MERSVQLPFSTHTRQEGKDVHASTGYVFKCLEIPTPAIKWNILIHPVCGFHQEYSIVLLHKQSSKHRIGVSCSKPEHKGEPRYRTQIPKFQRVPSPLPREICRFLNSFLSPAHFEPHKVPVLPWRSAPTWHFSPPPLTNHLPNCLWGLKWKTLLYMEMCLSPPTLSNQAARSSQCDTLMRPWHAVWFSALPSILNIRNVLKEWPSSLSQTGQNADTRLPDDKICKCRTILKPSSSLSRAGHGCASHKLLSFLT